MTTMMKFLRRIQKQGFVQCYDCHYVAAPSRGVFTEWNISKKGNASCLTS